MNTALRSFLSLVRSEKVRGSIGGLPKWVRIVLLVLIVALVYFLPILNPPFLTTPDSDFGGVLFTVAAYMLVALGLNIVVGYAGLLDLGYVGFYAVGAYSYAVARELHGNLGFLPAIAIAVAAAVVSGIVLGAPTLRVRGDYLAIVTLGFGEIIRLVAKNTEWLNAARGITQIPTPPSIPANPPLPAPATAPLFEIPHIKWDGWVPLVDNHHTTKVLKFGLADPIPYYWLALTVVILVIIADRLIKNSRVGRSWEATREDEDAAELMGVPTFKFKLLAFAMGAFIGGLSGALFASRNHFISPDQFQLLLSILFLAAVVVGGQGNRWGVMVGAALVAYLPERFRFLSDWRFLAFGVALMLLAIFRPQGLLPPRRTLRAKQAEHEIEALEEGLEEEVPHA